MTDASRWLAENKPNSEPLGLVWGDAKLGNILFDSAGQAQAVLDWEMVTLGNPVRDLAYSLVSYIRTTQGYGLPRYRQDFPRGKNGGVGGGYGPFSRRS